MHSTVTQGTSRQVANGNRARFLQVKPPLECLTPDYSLSFKRISNLLELYGS